jgi:RNA polymerase sigma-70 factor (ECF subfamily)
MVSAESDAERDFGELAPAAARLAFRVAWSVVRERGDAEEIAQEALLRVYRHFPLLRDPARFEPWLVRVAWRLGMDHLRAARRRERREMEAGRRSTLVAIPKQSREFLFALAEEIERLPRKLRMVLILAGIEGYDTQEISRLAGVPEGTVKSRLFLARKRLAERLEWIADDTKAR